MCRSSRRDLRPIVSNGSKSSDWHARRSSKPSTAPSRPSTEMTVSSEAGPGLIAAILAAPDGIGDGEPDGRIVEAIREGIGAEHGRQGQHDRAELIGRDLGHDRLGALRQKHRHAVSRIRCRAAAAHWRAGSNSPAAHHTSLWAEPGSRRGLRHARDRVRPNDRRCPTPYCREAGRTSGTPPGRPVEDGRAGES